MSTWREMARWKNETEIKWYICIAAGEMLQDDFVTRYPRRRSKDSKKVLV